MKYAQTVRGRFLCRPNRFIAEVEIDGKKEICHVKNTGRCQELLVPDACVILAYSNQPKRRTRYDLIAVYKGNLLINMDSQAPNRTMEEWLRSGEYFDDLEKIQPEARYGNSRFDFYLETKQKKIFAEVKGVTLERDGVVLFPDAPTERGLKHVRELIEAHQNGYEAYLFFVIQMEECDYFTPNRSTHAEFADALREAERMGVRLCAVNCRVTENEMTIHRAIPIRL